MATAPTLCGREQMLLHDVDWQTYKRLLWVFAERPRIRLTYDRGVLEIMSAPKQYERDSALLDRFIIVLTEELGLTLQSGRSTTLRRRHRQRGLGPDRCYWIASEPVARGKETRQGTLPDLVIETDSASSLLDRLRIYAVLRAREVWCLAKDRLLFYRLDGDAYAEITHSLAFPMVTPADLLRFLSLRMTCDDNTISREFRAWVQQAKGTVPPTP